MDTEALKQQYDLLLDQNQPTMKLKLRPKDAEDPNQRIPIVLAPAQAVSELARLGVTGGLEFRPTSGSKRPDYIAATREGAEGIGTYCPKAFANSDPDNLKPANKLVFLVPENYFVYRHTGPKWNSSYPPDILILRSMMWHEVMEQAYIYISLFDIKRFNDPFRLKELIRERKPFNQNPIHYAVIAKQREFVKELKFYHWAIEPSDPPFCVSEKEALQHKRSAEDAQHWAEHYEGLDWHTAAEKWEEARKYWNLAAQAWRFRVKGQSMDAPGFVGERFSCHPDPEGNAKECEENAETAKERRDAALGKTQQGATKPAPSWNVAGSGGGKITIHYSDWPHGFRAKILDYKERKVTEVSGTPGSKEGKVEWGKDAEAVDGVDNRLLFTTIVHKEQ